MSSLVALRRKGTNNFPALKEVNFRYFWTGQCVSLLGTWMQRTAQQWLVYSLTKSPLLLGILGVVQFTPVLLFTLFAGVFIDRFNKKRVLIITQSILMMLAFILAFLVWSGTVQYWHVLVIAGIMGCVNAWDMPTRQSFIPEMVEKKNIVNAIGLNSAVFNVARIIGPAIAGYLMVRIGTALCFFVNGVSFIAVIIGIVLIKPTYSHEKRASGNIFIDVKEGLKYIKSNKIILAAVLSMFAVGTFSMNSDVIIPSFATTVLHQGAGGYSILLSVMGVGSFLAALTVATRSRKGPSKKLLYGSSILVCLFQIGLLFTHSYLVSSIILSMVGFFTVAFSASVNTTIQINTSNEYRGRVMSVYTLANNGTTPIGNLFAGAITEKFAPNFGFFGCGFMALIFMIPILWLIRFDKKNGKV
ncbi:MFS transporter [Clostridium akagii]|uniref:MFS transporter n=1 Tax=Clostridium akagii TaxID=91623 RepID=UPI0004796027|nr:MFS transporter [Clostridium akagii]